MNKKNIIKIIITIVLLIGIIGTSYAYFVYSKYSGYNNELITGDIWMHYKESSVNINSDLEYNFSDYVHLNSLYDLNTEDDNVEKCVNYLHETYGDTWNGMTYENNGSSGFDGFEPSSNKNLTITPKFIDNVTVTGGSPTYYEYCSNNYGSGSGSGGGGPAKNTPSLHNYTVKKLATYNSSDYYNLIISDYLNGVLTNADKKFFEENGIIYNNTLSLLNSLSGLPYYEFIIDGKNTYKQKDIWYEIDLLHGDNHPTRTERAKDEFLKFSLVEIENNNVSILFQERTYDDLTNKRVWVDTISANDGEVHRVYRLYMSFIHEIKVGSASENNDYDFDTWNNEVYASVKVKVSGDFAEKNVEYNDVPGESIETDPSCFTFETIYVNQRNKNMTSDELNTCTNYMVNNNLVPDEYTLNSNLTENQINTCASYLLDTWNDGEDNGFLEYELNSNMTSEEIQVCASYLNDDLGSSWATGETAEAFCNGTGTKWGYTFQETLDYDDWWDYDQLDFFEEHNIISSVTKSTKDEYKSFCSGTGKLKTDYGTYTFLEMLDNYSYNNNQGGSNNPVISSYSLDKNKNKKYSINSIKNDLKRIALYIDYTSFTSSDLNFFEENNIISNSVNKQQVAREFCEGTGKISGNNFEGWIEDAYFQTEDLNNLTNENIILPNTYNAITYYDSSCGSDIVIPSNYPGTNYTLNTNMTNEELQACVDYLNNDLRWGWNTGETADAFCRGTGTNYGTTFQEFLDDNVFIPSELEYFQEHNIISAETTDIPITAINSYAFSGSLLRSVSIPSTIKYIGKKAFNFNNVLSVDVPSSVESSVCGVFDKYVVINTSTPLVCRYEFSNSGYSVSPEVG